MHTKTGKVIGPLVKSKFTKNVRPSKAFNAPPGVKTTKVTEARVGNLKKRALWLWDEPDSVDEDALDEIGRASCRERV